MTVETTTPEVQDTTPVPEESPETQEESTNTEESQESSQEESSESEAVETPEVESSNEEESESSEPLNKEEKQEVKEMIKKLKIKVNGKEDEVELDLNDEEKLREMAQWAKAGRMSLQDKAEIEKSWEAYQRELKDDPWTKLQELGLDPDELAEMRIQQRIEEMAKSPEQKAQEAMEKELEALRNQIKEKEDKEKQIEMERMQKEAEVEIEADIKEALGSTTLPSSQYVIKRVADAMLFAMDNGYEEITASQVIPIVEKEIRKEIQDTIDSLPTEVMEEFIGKKSLERLRQNRLKGMNKTNSPSEIVDTGKIKKVEEESKPKKIPMREFFRSI